MALFYFICGNVVRGVGAGTLKGANMKNIVNKGF